MIKLIENYIKDSDHTSWFNKTYPLGCYGIYAFMNFILFLILSLVGISNYLNIGICFIITSSIAIVWQKTFQNKRLLFLPILILIIDFGLFSLISMPIIWLKLIINIVIVLISCIYYRIFC